MAVNRQGISFWGDENVLELVAMITEFCEYTKIQRIAHFKQCILWYVNYTFFCFLFLKNPLVLLSLAAQPSQRENVNNLSPLMVSHHTQKTSE